MTNEHDGDHSLPGKEPTPECPSPEKPATGYLIDPAARSIAAWPYNGDWRTIAPALRIGRSPFTLVEIGGGDVIFVDDEGLLKPLEWFFAIKGGHQPFAGCGLVLSADDEGDSVSARIALPELKRRILHLRIVATDPVRFMAWEAADTAPRPRLMTLEAIEDWMQDIGNEPAPGGTHP